MHLARNDAELRNRLLEMMDSGRLKHEHIPDDYVWLAASVGKLQADAVSDRHSQRLAEERADRRNRRVDPASLRKASKETGIPVKTLQNRLRDHPRWDLDQLLAIPHQPARGRKANVSEND